MAGRKTDNKQDFIVNRVVAEIKDNKKGKNSYKGCYYTNRIKVDKEIFLTALEFFGPAVAERAAYTVRVKVCQTVEERTALNRTFGFLFGYCSYKEVDLSEQSVTVDARKGVNFVATLPNHVRILPYLWHDIKFELCGPLTENIQFSSDDVYVPINDRDKVRFEFFTGPGQLPAIHFRTEIGMHLMTNLL